MRKTIDYLGYKLRPDKVNIYGKVVKLPMKIRNYVIFDDLVIALLYYSDLLDLYPQENPKQNIWCYNSEGELLWKIEPNPQTREPCTGVEYVEDEDRVIAHIPTGFFYLDIKTGKVSDFEYNGGH